MTLLRGRRGSFDVVASLLEVLSDGACNKTKLASRANLASRSSAQYINLILRLNLVRKDDATNCFKIADKGWMFLEEYKKLKMLMDVESAKLS